MGQDREQVDRMNKVLIVKDTPSLNTYYIYKDYKLIPQGKQCPPTEPLQCSK